MAARSRTRGRRSETMVANYLRQWWPDARRVLAGDGKQHCDVEFHPLVSLEVKALAATTAWPTWCRQAAAQAHPGTVPVVVHRTPGVLDVAAWPIRARLVDWIATLGSTDCEGVMVDRGDGVREQWLTATMADLVTALQAVDTDDPGYPPYPCPADGEGVHHVGCGCDW